jgi:hypothetical protein
MISTGLFSLLSTAAPITALVDTRIYPVRLPTKPTLPAITYQSAGGAGEQTLNTSGFQRRRYQFDFYGLVYLDAEAVRDALVAFLNGYQGLLSDGTLLQNAEYLQPIDFDQQEALQYRCAVEFYLYFDFPRV